MDHKEFLASVPVEARAAMVARSNLAGLWHLAGHLGLILGVGTLIGLGVPGWWMLVPVQGVLIVFLFTLEHEATHRTPFANERLNDEVGRVAGFLLLLPFEWFRFFHLAHHRWTNIEGKDPELAGEKPATRLAWAWHVSGIPYWLAEVRLLVRLVWGRADDDFIPPLARSRVVWEARGMAVGYLIVAVNPILWPLLWWVWILPVLLGQPFLRLYLLAEHGDCPRVANMFENTRTTFTNRAVRFLAWNMPYHVEHHVWPQVPFHRLPELHGMMREELRVTADGYAAFTREYLERRPRWAGTEKTLNQWVGCERSGGGNHAGPDLAAAGALGVWRMRLRNGLALAAAAAVVAVMAVLFILPAVYPPRVPLGYIPGRILSYEVTVTKLGGMRGTFAVRLDRGEVVQVAAREGLVPGMEVCVRAVQRGERVEGFLVAVENCPAQ